MKKSIMLIITALLILLPAAHAWSGIKDISQSKKTISQYSLLEIDITIDAPYKNPFSPEDVDISAHILGPDGKNSLLPAFFSGERSVWKVRYTPVISGDFSYFISLTTPEGTWKSPVRQFSVKPSNGNGFIRKCKNNSRYLVFDSGKPFFGIGHNIAWVTDNNLEKYKRYFIDFNKYGCNLTRVWINCPWTLKIENEKVGYYNLADSEKLDRLVKLAEEHGIYVILVLDSYGSLMEEEGHWGENVWVSNPYNKTKGGPIARAADFFTDGTARKYYKDRLRYIISRWSYSPNILSFELWNEMDIPEDWAREMFSYMKSINPHGQLTTTSMGYPWSNNFDEGVIWRLPELDILQRHVYGNTEKDLSEHLISTDQALVDEFKKPLLVGEFGMDSGKSDARLDTTGKGTALHNSIWGSVFSGSFASALNWWWDEYIKRKGLYPHYRALGDFLEGTDWVSKNVSFAETTPVTLELPGAAMQASENITVPTRKYWGDMKYREFTVENNGDVAGGIVNYYLHGTTKNSIRLEPVFHVDFPSDGKFIISVGTVSEEAHLKVFLDNKEIVSRQFTTGPGSGPWKTSNYLQKYNIYQCGYDLQIPVDVPKGPHTIKLANTGKDWLGIEDIILQNYTGPSFADARVTGLVIGDEILLWIQNKQNGPHNAIKGVEPNPVTNASFMLKNIENGRYKVEWWDTYEGKITSQDTITADNNMVRIDIPDFSKDIACKVRKTSSAE